MTCFFFAIERQMSTTSREIRAGCPSHTRTIYTRRNGLLATELSGLFLGKQGIQKYLAHCSQIMRVKNLNDIHLFVNRKGCECDDPFDREWASRNRNVLIRSAVSLYEQLCPSNPKPAVSIVSSITSWTFQPVSYEGDAGILLDNDSTLSLATAAPRKSFDALKSRMFGNNWGSEEGELSTTERCPRLAPFPRTPRAFEGTSYRLVVVDNCSCL